MQPLTEHWTHERAPLAETGLNPVAQVEQLFYWLHTAQLLILHKMQDTNCPGPLLKVEKPWAHWLQFMLALQAKQLGTAQLMQFPCKFVKLGKQLKQEVEVLQTWQLEILQFPMQVALI